ncbi:MAG: hypothetical protein M3220_22735 [Chloroflexota bacterium]|nr:hypothetical protein [Chloroflexota bacterium]
MRPGWRMRAVTWLLLAESVRANRQAYPDLPTAWLPHGLGNTLALWLPELLGTLDDTWKLDGWYQDHPTLSAVYCALRNLCVDNRSWGVYVAPAALGYALSHPRFNIYKGEMGSWRFLGFGLDAIPHGITAYALTRLLQDGIQELARALPEESPLAPLIQILAKRSMLSTGAVLTLLSTIWEVGEYLMQQDELRRAGGDRSAVNMEWDLEDTIFDLLANTLGWIIANWQRPRET